MLPLVYFLNVVIINQLEKCIDAHSLNTFFLSLQIYQFLLLVPVHLFYDPYIV